MMSEELYGPELCARCKDPLLVMFGSPARQYENNLVLEFHGGYGMFTDCIMDCPADSIILCHECAHALCDFLNIDCDNWHTHVKDGPQHEDHHHRM